MKSPEAPAVLAESISDEAANAAPDSATDESKVTGISAILGPERLRTYNDEPF